MAELRVVRLQPPSRGLDTMSSPEYVASDQTPSLTNFLPGYRGKVVLRGQFTSPSSQAHSSAATVPPGMWTFEDYVLLNAGGDVKRIDATAGTVSASLTASASRLPGPSFARLGDYVYGVASLSWPTATNTRMLMRWDGTDAAGGLVDQSNAPRGPVAVASHLQRLWCLGGSVPGTTTPVYRNRLYWSDTGGPTADTVAQWSDDVSGLPNQIVLEGDDGDYGTALARVANNLVVFRRRSIYMLYGTSSSNFAVRPIARSRGCQWPGTVVEHETGVYFLSDDGFYVFDGSEVRSVSRDIDELIAEQVRTSGVTWSATRLPNDAILLNARYGTTTVYPLVYHIPTGSWTQLSSNVQETTGPAWVGRTASYSVVYDGERLFRADYLYDINSSGKELDSGSTYVAIPGTYLTRTARLESPPLAAQLHRVLIDYKLFPRDDVATTLTVEVRNGTGTTLSTHTLTSSDTDVRQRAVLDVFAECSEVAVRITGPGTASFGSVEIYDIHVEYQPAHQRHG